jgi:hypothetical protein
LDEVLTSVTVTPDGPHNLQVALKAKGTKQFAVFLLVFREMGGISSPVRATPVDARLTQQRAVALFDGDRARMDDVIRGAAAEGRRQATPPTVAGWPRHASSCR